MNQTPIIEQLSLKVLEQATEGVLIAEIESKKFIYANETICDWLGYSQEEMLNFSVFDIHPPEQVEDVVAVFMAQATGKIKYAQSIPCMRKNGAIFWADINTFKIEHSDIAYNVGIFSDATERRKTAKTLDSVERLLASILDSIPDRMMVIDRNFKIKYTNIPRDTLGEESGDSFCYGAGFQRSFVCDDCCGKKVFETGQYAEAEKTNTVDGRVYEIRAFPIRDQDQNVEYVVEYSRDITSKKNAEEERLKLERQIQHAQKLESIGVLAGGIAHDFNNLLSGIFGNIELGLLKSKDNQVTKYLQSVQAMMGRARALTNQLLSFSKGSITRITTDDLAPLVRKTVNFALSGSNVIPVFDLPEDLRLCLMDINRMGQVVENLVINAKQAMPDGGYIRLCAQNINVGPKEHGFLKAGHYVRLSIQDEGHGIPKEIQSKIFDPFFTTKEKGSGLGLTVCHSILREHHGTLEFESGPYRGTVFHLLIPASDQSLGDAVPEETLIHRGQGKILIMDDQETIRKILIDMLQSFGYQVEETENGSQALSHFTLSREKGEPYAAVILDLTVPGGIGAKKVIQEIRNLDQALPAFVLSGYANVPIMAQPELFGFTASIHKPFTRKSLAEVLNKHLGGGS